MVQRRLLEIAVEQFGQRGLEGASTRDIAAAAGTAMSSITYHYGGKDGLYLAAADFVADQLGADDDSEAIEEQTATDDPATARAAIHAIVVRFLDRIKQRDADSWALFIMREQMNPTEAFERIYAGAMGRQSRAMVQLICIATGVKDGYAARLAAISLIGQVLVVKAARATCRRLLECDQLNPAIIDDYAARVAANIDAILDRMIAERQEQA
ncbi:MAG: CerR family C-terminal domain-containing protein [Sphingomonas sp.]|uniref:CerR family C-terminal domain-containing protein n=1 Tax=Sphingomonas sp. TaxID=28214 RepID=UPI001ACF82D7|nr:CerR family C-terminal domain-containing protein [Sphingomonas sp.]MBN8807270.1 CerR family C-terminal domain-containing protein [Sphingomonas sp.]